MYIYIYIYIYVYIYIYIYIYIYTHKTISEKHVGGSPSVYLLSEPQRACFREASFASEWVCQHRSQ